MAEPAILHTDAILRILTSRNLQVNVWSNAPTVEQIHIFSRAGASLARRNPRGTGLLNLMLRGTPSFSQEVRDETVKLMKQEVFRLGTAHVILLGGLTGAAVRAFMSTVMLLARPGVPNKVFGEAETAATWLAPLLTQGAEAWSPTELVALVKHAIASA
ncbi:MAG: hypothetical protein ABJE95_32840 [Byssovorax sp.]